MTDDNELVIRSITDHDDGSATVTLDLGPEALRLLAEIGFRTVIKQAIAREELDGETKA